MAYKRTVEIPNTWDGLRQPDSVEDETDYFPGTSLDSKWSEWDAPGDSTVSVSGGAVHLTQTTSAGDDYAGIIQALPADNDIVITAKVRLACLYGTGIGICSLVIGEDLATNPSTGSFYNSQVSVTTTGIFWDATTYTNYTTWSATIGTEDMPADHIVYVRWYIDRTAATVTALCSADGRTWMRYSARALAGTPVSSLDYFGVATMNTTGGDLTAHCDMVRLDLSADMELEIGGPLQVTV